MIKSLSVHIQSVYTLDKDSIVKGLLQCASWDSDE
jgi:hypothetical protein